MFTFARIRTEAQRQAEAQKTEAEKATSDRLAAIGEKKGFQEAQREAAKKMDQVAANLKETIQAAGVERQELIDRISALEDVIGETQKVVAEVQNTPEMAAERIQPSVDQIRKIVAEAATENDRARVELGKELSAMLKKEIKGVQKTQQNVIEEAAEAAAHAAMKDFQPWCERVNDSVSALESEVAAGLAGLKKAQARQERRIKALERAKGKGRKHD